jgi:predicted metal-dependent phosphoesterase TrpH
MKVELHLHTSRYSACAIVTPRQVMHTLDECGYDAVYVTEHDAVWPDAELDELRARFPRLRIFPGVELSLGEDGGQHLLVLGTNDPWYLRQADAPEVIDRARADGCLTVLAHPFRWSDSAGMLAAEILPDALEYHTCNHAPEAAELSRMAAAARGLPLTNAGDVHALNAVDRFWIETHRDLDRPTDLREVVCDRAYDNRQRKPARGWFRSRR